MNLEEYEELITQQKTESNPNARVIDSLIGKTIVSIAGGAGDDELVMACANGSSIRFYHQQDCCEHVIIDQIDGDVLDLIGRPILMAEEVTEQFDSNNGYDSGTWTFYKFATDIGYVTIKWLGTSNGYYSESVDWQWSDL